MEPLGVSNDLVGQIAGFTSLRDVDLLELSLLKSIYTIVNPVEVSLVTVDSQNNIKKKVDYASGRKGTISQTDTVDESFLIAVEQVDKGTRDYCSVAHGEGSLNLFLLDQDRKLAHFVSIISMSATLSKTESQQIIGMLKIYRNFRELLKEAQTDELTGLANRKTFENTARHIYEAILSAPQPIQNEKRTFKPTAPFWMVMVDVDHFKRINDSQGHIIGDEVLVRIAQTIQCSVRTDDFVFRYGGEEFSVILQADSKEVCSAILERMRSAVEAINFSHIGKTTISIGAVEMDPGAFYLSNVEKADKALYHSKDNGRNQVTFFSDIVSANDQGNVTSIDLF